ncbi:hypothetical protein ABEF95_011256 [Exophiala dermatitidis]
MQEEANSFTNFTEGFGSPSDERRGARDALNMPGAMERADSSPNLQDLGSEGPPLSPAEKRRNKLGYHRTAVACGHCRRRKIRCMPAFDDPAGRCQNCIRLKKECQFFPVDQQNPGPGRRVRSATKSTEGGPNEADSFLPVSSPGMILRTGSFEHLDPIDSPMNTPPMSRGSPGYSDFHPVTRSMSGSGFDYANPYGYPQQPQPQQQHQIMDRSPFTTPLSGSQANDSSSAPFYPQYGHSLQGGYPIAFTTGSLPATTPTMSRDRAFGYHTASPNGYPWAQSPARSVSMGETEDSPHNFPPAYRTQTYPSFERRITADMPQLPATSSPFVPLGAENQPGGIVELPQPMSYQPLPPGMQPEWAASEQQTQFTGSSGAPTPAWYPQQPSSTDLGSDDRRSQILPSQHLSPQ